MIPYGLIQQKMYRSKRQKEKQTRLNIKKCLSKIDYTDSNMIRGVIAGNFDVIHPGYIKMFKECKERCDYLVVLLHGDPSRDRPEKLTPILNVMEREEMLLELRSVDQVVHYQTEEELKDILTKQDYHIRFLGDDYIGKKFTGDDLETEIYYIDRSHGWSTTRYKKLIAMSLNKRI